MLFPGNVKLERNPTVSFFILDKKAYLYFIKIVSGIKDENVFDSALIFQLISELSDAIENGSHPLHKLDTIDFEKIGSLYESKSFDADKKSERESFLLFLKNLKLNLSIASEIDIDYLLDFYFYYSCVVSFNAEWYLQPLMPISLQLSNNARDFSSVFNQILDFDNTNRILEPIKINTSSIGYNTIVDTAARNLLNDFSNFPLLDNNSPHILEVFYFQKFHDLVIGELDYDLCIFYYP